MPDAVERGVTGLTRGTQWRGNLSQRLLSSIADEEGVPPYDLPPLGETIDIEALEAFLGASNGSAKATFRYLRRRITVEANGRITVSDSTSDDGLYVARCHTCGQVKRHVDLETAQDFFAVHADQRHAVELFREAEIGQAKNPPSTETEDEEGAD